MPNILDTLSPGFKALSAQLTAAGFDVAALAAGTGDSLKVQIVAREIAARETADVAAAVEAATAALRAELAAEAKNVVTLSAVAAAVGLTPEAAGKLDAAALKAHLDQRVSAAAIEQLATAGVPAAQLPKPSAEGQLPSVLTFREFSALGPIDKMAFSKRGGVLSN